MAASPTAGGAGTWGAVAHRSWLLAALAALGAGLLASGLVTCALPPPTPATDGGWECTESGCTNLRHFNCQSDAECDGSSWVCNRETHVCMVRCTPGSPCPTGHPTCAPMPGVSTSVCQCSAQQDCDATGIASVCDRTDRVCERLCQGESGCLDFGARQTCVGGRCEARPDAGSPDAGP